jgi:alpha-beta hydrolase superfamily lysophospholipase
MIDILLRENLIRFPDIPAFVYGHSLGGGIVLNYLLKREPAELKGAIISSPWLKLGSDPSVLKKKMVSLMKGIIPGITLSNGLNPAHLSNDSSVVKAYIDDPLVHDRISLSLADCAFKAAANAIKEASDLKIPVLIMHGSDDKICSPDGSKEFASRTRMAELKIWKGGFHELHNDINKYEVINYVINWINQKI